MCEYGEGEKERRTHSEEHEDDVDPILLYEALLRRRLDGLALGREWRRCAQLGTGQQIHIISPEVVKPKVKSKAYRGGRVGVDTVIVALRGAQTAAVPLGSVGHAPS